MEYGIQKYLDSAVSVLDRFGLAKAPQESQLAKILQEAVTVNEAKVTAIARVVQYEDTFNALVRNNLEAMDVSEKYKNITSMFDSIRDDSKRMVGQLTKGKLGFKDRAQNTWMNLTRGSTHARFEAIQKTYLDVSTRTSAQLERENAIIEGYCDFRLAMKEAEIMAYEVLELQTTKLEESKKAFTDSVEKVNACEAKEGSEHSKLQLDRDQAHREVENQDKKYQLIKDVAENLKIGYDVGETLVGKLNQTHNLKDRVYKQAITFFTTNGHVFTTLDAVYTSQKGMHEQTQALESMKAGINKGLEDVASLGDVLQENALRAGYGATIDAKSVQILVDSIANFQDNSYKMIEQLRTEATENAKAISEIVDNGKQRVAKSLENYIAPKQPVVTPAITA